MFGKVIAGASIAGALAFGTVGIVGATTPSTPSSTSAPSTPSTPSTPKTATVPCSFFSQVKPDLQAFATDLNSAVAQAQNIENQAKTAGYTKLAKDIGRRVKTVQTQEKQVGKRLQKIDARCSSTSG